MTTRRNRHERSIGSTSQAYKLTKYSLLTYRPYPVHPVKRVSKWELLSKWEKRLKLSRSNTVHMIEASRGWLCIKKLRGVYYVSPLPECKEAIENYILYDRKNHPAKNGVGRLYTSLTELDRVNATLYPDGLDIFPQS
jgi:hypothetical protein